MKRLVVGLCLAAFAGSAHTKSCGWPLTILNEAGAPTTLHLKSFYGYESEAPPPTLFERGNVGPVVDDVPKYFSEDDVLFLKSNERRVITFRTLCGAQAWLNWRYLNDGKESSGQMPLHTGKRELRVK